MIYTDSQLKEKIVRMIESFENEVVEFKKHAQIIRLMTLVNIFLHLAMKQIFGDYRRRG